LPGTPCQVWQELPVSRHSIQLAISTAPDTLRRHY
jgi:hypothetical protein